MGGSAFGDEDTKMAAGCSGCPMHCLLVPRLVEELPERDKCCEKR
jgi:hypothetical protein